MNSRNVNGLCVSLTLSCFCILLMELFILNVSDLLIFQLLTPPADVYVTVFVSKTTPKVMILKPFSRTVDHRLRKRKKTG